MPNIVRSPLTTSTSCHRTMLRPRRAASPPTIVSPPHRHRASAAPTVQHYSYTHNLHSLPLLLPLTLSRPSSPEKRETPATATGT